MGVEKKYGSMLGCIVLLFASCLSFQTKLPRIPSKRSGWRSQRSFSSQSKGQAAASKPKRIDQNYMIPFDPSSASNLSGEMSDGKSSNSNLGNDGNNISINDNSSNNYVEDKTSTYTLGISRHYFEQMEERSGKDYRWIKPLSKPVSKVMM